LSPLIQTKAAVTMRLKCDKFRVQKLRLIRWGQKLAGPKISCSLYHSRVFFSWLSRALLLTMSDYLDRLRIYVV